MRQPTITEWTPEQKQFLLKWLTNGEFSHSIEKFYMYMLNKRRKWFRAKSLLRELPRGLKLQKEHEDEIRDLLMIDEERLQYVCGAIAAVYEGAAMWEKKYNEYVRRVSDTNVTELQHQITGLEGRNAVLEATLCDILEQQQKKSAEFVDEFTKLADTSNNEAMSLYHQVDQQRQQIREQRETIRKQQSIIDAVHAAFQDYKSEQV